MKVEGETELLGQLSPRKPEFRHSDPYETEATATNSPSEPTSQPLDERKRRNYSSSISREAGTNNIDNAAVTAEGKQIKNEQTMVSSNTDIIAGIEGRPMIRTRSFDSCIAKRTRSHTKLT